MDSGTGSGLRRVAWRTGSQTSATTAAGRSGARGTETPRAAVAALQAGAGQGTGAAGGGHVAGYQGVFLQSAASQEGYHYRQLLLQKGQLQSGGGAIRGSHQVERGR